MATGIGRKIAAGGGVDESTVVATGETRGGGRCGSCGLELLSTDFGGLAKTGPLRLCSWAASTATCILAGRLSGFILEPAPPAIRSGRQLI